MKNLFTSLLLFFSIFHNLPAQKPSATELLGEWKGQMLLAGSHSFDIQLQLECEIDGTVQGKLFYQCPSYLPCNCGYTIVGVFSSSIYEGLLKFETLDKEGSEMCGHFSGTLQLDQRSRTLSGSTSGGYTIRLSQVRQYRQNQCDRIVKPSGNTRTEKTIGQQPKQAASVCSCCRGKGSSQSCAACNGKGRTTYTYYIDGIPYQQTDACGGIGCNNGKMRCYCCSGTGKGK